MGNAPSMLTCHIDLVTTSNFARTVRDGLGDAQAQAHGEPDESVQEGSQGQPVALLTSGPSLSQLPLAPGDFEALHMLYKLMYLEGQLEQMGQHPANQPGSNGSHQLEATLAI